MRISAPVGTFLGCALGLLLVGPARAQQDASIASQPERAWEVYRIFHRHCADCHGGHRAKPKGKFGHVLDLERLSSDEDYIVPGAPDDSEIYRLMIDPNPDFRMPPPDSDAPPVSAEERDMVRAWIAAGAGLGTVAVAPAAVQSAPAEKAATTGSGVSLLPLVARLHPLVVHFPIALILAALGAELLGLREAVRWCLWIGALGAVGSIGSGWLAADLEGYRPDTILGHRWLGVATSVFALASAITLEITRKRPGNRGMLLVKILLAVTAVLVGITGHTGGTLIHGEWMGEDLRIEVLPEASEP